MIIPRLNSSQFDLHVLAEQEAHLALLDEQSYDLKVSLKDLQLKLESLEARQDPLEMSLHLLRADLTAMERDLTGSSQQISSLELTTERLTSEASQMDAKIYVLENDPRIPHLMTLEPRLNDFQNGVEDTLGNFDERMINLNQKVRKHQIILVSTSVARR